MICTATIDGELKTFDLQHPIDISIPVTETLPVNAFSLPLAVFTPFRVGTFVGSVEEGGSLRCDVITFAPHGNGTHTECVGHIAGKQYTLLQCLQNTLHVARLVTVDVTSAGNCLTKRVLSDSWPEEHAEYHTALIIRTRPNHPEKRSMKWSGSNPPFIEPDAMQLIVERGVQHLLVDLPSVDPEKDDGMLKAHHIFWQWPESPRMHSTITELIYIPDEVEDGLYLLNINASAVDADAAPSRPMLYECLKSS